MFTIDVSSMICFLREKFLKDNYHKYDAETRTMTKNALLVKTCLQMTDSKRENSRSTYLWVIMCGDTNVFMAHGPIEIDNLSEFKNVSNHDSCWRSEIRSYISKIYFQFAETLGEKRPIDADSRCSLTFSEVRDVFIKYKRDDDYFNTLVEIDYRRE